MLKRLIKRIKIERLIAQLTKTRPPSLLAMMQIEWFKFWLRRRAIRWAP